MRLVIPTVLAVMVAWLTFSALRRSARDAGVRVCRRCSYPMAGLLSEQCPECGGAFAERPPVYAGFAIRALVAAKVGAWVFGFPFFALVVAIIISLKFSSHTQFDATVREYRSLISPTSGAFERVAMNCDMVTESRPYRKPPYEIITLDWSIEFKGEPEVTVTYGDGAVTLTSDGRHDRHEGALTTSVLFDWLADVYGNNEPQLRHEAAEIVAFLDAMINPMQTAPQVRNFQGTRHVVTGGGGMPRRSMWGYVIVIAVMAIWAGGAAAIICKGARRHQALINGLQMRTS